MGFLDKVKSYIPKNSKKQFKKEVQSEKKQKYLFGWQEGSDSFTRSRNTSKIKQWGKKLEKFVTFFQGNIFSRDTIKQNANLMAMIGLVLILLCIYIIAFSPYFKISPNQVLVEASTPGVDIGIAYRALENTYGESIFLIDKDEITRNLKSSLKNIESVSIDRLYPNGVKVLITWSPILFDTTITGIPEKKWWLSSNGVLIPANDLGKTSTKYHLELVGNSLIGDVFLQYKQAISGQTMHTIAKIYEVFESEWKDLTLARSRYFLAENELHITLESNTKIIFSLQDDSPIQKPNEISPVVLNELITVRTYITENRSKLIDGSIIYIDARIPGKLFICRDEKPCVSNLLLVYGDVYK